MTNKPADVNAKQDLLHDLFTFNDYDLDDRFVIRDGKRHRFAVIVPGGGYEFVCDVLEGTPIAKKLNELGISAFIVWYRVKEKALYPAPQQDLARAVKEILSKADTYFLEKETYSIWGFSAGGHLSASFCTETMGWPQFGLPKPRALILGYPVISMRKELTHMGSHDFLLGKDASFEQECAASIDEHVTGTFPPTFLWCGEADHIVSPENTQRMAAALKAADVPFVCETFPGVDHGASIGTGTAAEGWIDKAVAFWEAQIISC